MKKNKYIEFKVNKKVVTGIVAISCFLGLSTTVFAFNYADFRITDEAPIIKAGSGGYEKGGDTSNIIVTASDKEDGDLTDKITYKAFYYEDSNSAPIVIEGKVSDNNMGDLIDPNIDGSHATFVYTVTDSDGNTTSTTVDYRDFFSYSTNPLLKK